MKIAVWHNLRSGGAKRALHMHVKGLLERGHHLEAFTTTLSDSTYLPLTDFINEERFPLANMRARSRSRRLIPRACRSEQAELRLDRIQQMVLHGKECGERIQAGNFDVLFANSCTLMYNSCIGNSVDMPSLMYLQEPYRPFYEAQPRLPWLLPTVGTRHPRNPIKRAAERIRELHDLHAIRLQASEEVRWAQSYDRILCNSQFSRESILRAYNLDSKVCYLGIDVNFFALSPSPKEQYVVGVGRMHHSKRVAYAIQALAAIPAAIRPPLVWIGDGCDDWYHSQIQELARDHGVAFHHTTMASEQELQQVMAKAACFLYTPQLEPFGLAPLEANACGTAVVAIGEGGLRETIAHGVNGFLTLDNDPLQLADYISRFTQDLFYAKEFGRQARDHVCRNWAMNDAIDRVEQQLLSVA